MPALPFANLAELRALPTDKLPAICLDVAAFVVGATREKEGHLVSSLATTELTVALHYTFNTPTDILIWDVGHQAYVHKVVTDRASVFHTNRQMGGLSGFTSRSESPFDPFGAGHSGTSISALGGFAEAARLQNLTRKHIAVIGDGALTGGMSFEALNNLGTSDLDILLVLNDNEESIDPNTGALHEFQGYEAFFTSLGWGYSGPINGHDISRLCNQFAQEKERTGTRVLHVKTKKKRLSDWRAELGLPNSEIRNLKSEIRISYQDFFAEKLIELAKADARIVAITPAMLSGSSLIKFQAAFPERTFDVGIAEQHAVTFAAGLAADGFKPLVHLYSTFAQRAYDQIIHDVALQNLPVVFALDRAGLVGEDGATHHGAFDLSFLNPIPNLHILAPMNAAELRGMLTYAFAQAGPVAIRYPRGGEAAFTAQEAAIECGSFSHLVTGGGVVVVSLGTIGQTVQEALSHLNNPAVGHIDLRFLKPWNDAALHKALAPYHTIVTAEDGTMRGGLHDTMAAWLAQHLPGKKCAGIGLPDRFIAHGHPAQLAEEAGLSSKNIAEKLRLLLP